MKKIVVLMIFAAACVMLMASLSPAQSATADATFTVNTVRDAVDNNIGDGVCAASTPGGTFCTLRAAIQEANARYATFGGMYTISLSSGSFLIPGTYTLTIDGANEDNAATGDLDIKCNLLIQNINVSFPTFISASGINERVFQIIQPPGPPINVTISHVSIVNGKGTLAGGGIHNGSGGTLTLDSVTVMSNTATGAGGGIFHAGDTIVLESSTVRANKVSNAVTGGGGIFNFGPVMILNNSTVVSNVVSTNVTSSANAGGGGIFNQGGSLVLNNVSVLSNTLVVSSTNTSAAGGGVFSTGPLTVTNSTVRGNVSQARGGNPSSAGGGIATSGASLKMIGGDVSGNSTLIQNGIAGDGGGLSINGSRTTIYRTIVSSNGAGSGAGLQVSSPDVTITDSAFNFNSALNGPNSTGQAGGILNSGTLQISGTTFDGNTAQGISNNGRGGGIYNSSRLTVTNSTFFVNQANDSGGGIFNDGTAYLANVTLSLNAADFDQSNAGDGGGIFNMPTAALFLRHTLFSNNFDLTSSGNIFPDCAGTLISEGHNLVQSSTGCTLLTQNGEIIGQNPNLGILQNNGGPTLTMALPPNSVAVNGGDPSGCKDVNGNPLLSDQRGFARVGACDIGAFEYVLRVFLPLIRR